MRKLLLLLVLLSAAFVYGFATHRYRIFPYEPIHGLWTAIGAAQGSGAEKAPPDRQGMWVRARDAAAQGEAPDMGAVRDLAGLGYMDGYEPAPDDSGVTFNAQGATHAGLNLVLSGHAPEASLMDMEGNLLHEWKAPLADIWPQMNPAELSGHKTFWRRAFVYPDGDLLAIFDGIGMIRLNRDSELVWANMGRMHHDLDLDEEGNIHTLSRRLVTEHERLKLTGSIEEDYIVVLTPEGKVLSRTSILDCFLDSDYYAVISLAAKQGDILHVNTIELMDGRFADRHPLFARGNVLISAPTVNTIAVIDPAAKKVLWALSGLFQFQHQPTVLENGNLLLFDNLGENGRSKVIELDPLTQEILWSYRDSPERTFSSYFLGSCQRLPNDNTLITESAVGRAFEVNPAGEIVWEYVNPQRAGDDGSLIASLLEVVRLEPDDFTADFAAILTE